MSLDLDRLYEEAKKDNGDIQQSDVLWLIFEVRCLRREVAELRRGPKLGPGPASLDDWWDQ
jgi:hypothetical protein